MKFLSFFLTGLFFLSFFSGFSQWTQKADFGGTPRIAAVGFSIGNKGYIGTGLDTNTFTQDFWEYNQSSNTWAQISDFGGIARHDAVSFAIGDKAFVGAGWRNLMTGPILNDFWVYDNISNFWTQIADLPGERYAAIGFAINAKGYLALGSLNYFSQQNNFYEDIWEYDTLTNSWTQKQNFLGGKRSKAVGFSIGNKGYIGTGVDTNGTYGVYYRDFWEYDPISDTWAQKSDFGGIERINAVAFAISNKGYVGTGWDSNGTYLNDFWEYNPITNGWLQIDSLPSNPRFDAVGFNIGNKGYVGTGHAGSFLAKDFWEYGPNTTSVEKAIQITSLKVSVDNFSGEISVVNETDLKSRLVIYSIHGQEMYHEEISPNTNKILTISFLSSGIYLAALTNKSQMYSQKFVY